MQFGVEACVTGIRAGAVTGLLKTTVWFSEIAFVIVCMYVSPLRKLCGNAKMSIPLLYDTLLQHGVRHFFESRNIRAHNKIVFLPQFFGGI